MSDGGDRFTSYTQLLEMMKHDAQLWHDVLFTSGGKLELTKCGFHAFDYEFDEDGQARKKHREECEIVLQDQNGDDMPIQSKTIYTMRKNLGHFKAPAGTQQAQFECTKDTAIKLAGEILECSGSCEDICMLIEAVRNPAV